MICSLFDYVNDDDAYDYDMGDDDEDDNYDDMCVAIDFSFILAYFLSIAYISYTNIPALISCAPTLELNEISSRTTYHNHQYIHTCITHNIHKLSLTENTTTKIRIHTHSHKLKIQE